MKKNFLAGILVLGLASSVSAADPGEELIQSVRLVGDENTAQVLSDVNEQQKKICGRSFSSEEVRAKIETGEYAELISLISIDPATYRERLNSGNFSNCN